MNIINLTDFTFRITCTMYNVHCTLRTQNKNVRAYFIIKMHAPPTPQLIKLRSQVSQTECSNISETVKKLWSIKILINQSIYFDLSRYSSLLRYSSLSRHSSLVSVLSRHFVILKLQSVKTLQSCTLVCPIRYHCLLQMAFFLLPAANLQLLNAQNLLFIGNYKLPIANC